MIDAKLIAAHQWVVDETERQPAWWVEQTAWAFIAVDIVAAALTWIGGWSLIGVFFTLFLGSVMLFLSRSPAHLSLAAAKAQPYRILLLVLAGGGIFVWMIDPGAGAAANFLSSVILLACNYFAACQAPRPRKRRQTAAQGGAA